jgi:hypothetical protein
MGLGHGAFVAANGGEVKPGGWQGQGTGRRRSAIQGLAT